MDNHFDHCSAHVTAVEQDGFLLKIHVQIPSDSVISCRELSSRIEQISGHLRRMKCCESISRNQLAFARIEDSFHRVRALGDDVEGRVAVNFIDYGHEKLLLLSDIIVVDPPLSDVLTTVRPLAEEFYLDGVLLLRPLIPEEIVALSEKIVFQTLPCRFRRLHPELSLIELAATNISGHQKLFSHIVVELGFGKKCSTEDITKYLRIKIRVDDPSTMQPGRPFANPYAVPPPSMLGSQVSTMPGSPPMTPPLGAQTPSILRTQPRITHVPQQTTSVNARLSKFKKDAALNIPGSGVLYGQAGSPQAQLADRKQYAVTDGRTCTTAPTLPVNSTHNAYISHVEDGPFNFTIQLKSSVEELLPKLRNILVRYQNSPITAQLIPGSVVMAKSRDETLRRGVIMNVQPETCKVYYIDFGNFDELPYSDIFQLPNTAAELSPAMAMQFCLADLKSMRITDSNKDYFARLLLGKQVLIRVTERESNSPFQYCDITWEGRSVREILLNLNSPMQYSYQYAPRGREAPVSVVYADGPSQFFVQYRSELNVVNQIQEALASYCPSQPRVTDLSAINIGSPVASIFPADQRWYRALVMGMDCNCVNVFYVDYGNRAEVTPNQICLLSRDLVNKWKTQAIECCLIGFDTTTPDMYMAEKMEDTTTGHSYTLRLHSILSGFRLSVDLIDDQGNSIATLMKNLLNERQKSISQPAAYTEKKKHQPNNDDDKSSQHSNDSGGLKNKYQRPGTRGDRGNKADQRGDRKFEDRNKFEERQNPYSQHDDRSGGDYKQNNDARSDWKKGAKKAYMDQSNEWDNQESKPFTKKSSWGDKQDLGGGGFKKQEWKSDDKKVGWSGDSSNRGNRPERTDRQGGGFRSDGDRQGGGFRSDGDRQGGGFRSDGDRQGGGFRSDGDRKVGSNRFERKPFNNDDDRNGERGDNWSSKDRMFGDRVRDNNQFGDREKFGDRGGRDNNRFGDRENKFGDRDNRFGSRENKFGDKDNKFSNRDKPFNRDTRKPKWNVDDAVQKASVVAEECWEDSGVQAPVKRPSVVISEYTHQEIQVGGEYKVLFAGMDPSIKDVYVQLSDCEPQLDKIRSMIDADTSAASRPISNPVLAMPVLARFDDDGLLYRATIKSISKVATGQVDVLFVDFGNRAVNPLSEVFTISSELISIPIQAIHVVVTDMPSIPSANLDACQAHFDVDHLTLKPSRTTTINLEQVVEGLLIRPDGQSVAECVKNDPACNGENRVAAKSEYEVTPSTVFESEVQTMEGGPSGDESLVLWRERLELLLHQWLLGKVVKKCEDGSAYLVKIMAVLDLIVTAQSEVKLSPELAPGTEVILAVSGLAKDRLLVNYYNRLGQSLENKDAILSIAPMQIVQRKGIFTVCHTEAPTIYLQHNDSTVLDNLLERMFEKYENSDFDPCEFNVGDLCAAKSFDGNWYRAKIHSIVEHSYTVKYLDYGNTEELRVENLRKLVEEFHFPELCVNCVLPVTYKDMSCVETLGDCPLECTFIELNPLNNVWIVDLCTMGEVKENFALKWIEAGKAVSMTDISADPKYREPWWNLKKGDCLPVVITHCETPEEFYANLFYQTYDLDALQEKIQDLPDGGDLGEVFVAKYTEDSRWYRAVSDGDKVRFLDYGNTDLSVDKKSLPANLIHPAKGYAIPMFLCVRATGGQWTEPAEKLFDEFINKEGLCAEIVCASFEIIVDLRVGDESLATTLIDEGFAARFNTPLNDVLVDCIVEDELPLGKVPAFVTATTSINDFYIQENSKTDILDLLASRLEAADSYEVIENPPLGQHLVAKFVEDSVWYRAKVVNINPIEVLFLDYGNVSPASEFKVLPSDLAAFPSLAWHCSINMEDTPAINDQFTSLVDASTVFDVRFEGMKDSLHVVQLFVDNENPFKLPIVENVKSDAPTTVELSDEVQVLSKPIPPALSKSLYKDCVLCHSNGPYDFYVQTDDDHIQIEEMANALFEAGTFPSVEHVKKGDFVVAQFTEDDAYYRAIVTDLEPEVVVHFIDYGNSCPASCFHELPSPLKKIPQLAIRCSLQTPVGGWSVDAIDKFTTLLNSDTKSINLIIISPGDPAIVDVEINGSSITRQLTSNTEHTSHSTSDTPRIENDEPKLQTSGQCYLASATPKECYIHDFSSTADLDFITKELASIDVGDPNSVLKDVQVDDLVAAFHEDALYRARITKLHPPEVHFVDYGNESQVDNFFKLPDTIKNKKPLALKVELDLGDGVELNDDGVVELMSLAGDGVNYTQTRPSVVELTVDGRKLTDLLKSYLVISDSSCESPDQNNPSIAPTAIDAIKEDDYIPITIAHVNSPSDFYYQLDVTKVNEMTSRLNEAEGFLNVEKCEVGQVICAKYSVDEQWYRATILATEPSVTVIFLDYGNSAEVVEMKQLPDDLAKMPALCVKACLKTEGPPWTEDQASKFLEIAYGDADFTCSVIENCTDFVIVKLKSSEVGDVTTYLGRSGFFTTSESEYGTPEVLSQGDITPTVENDVSALVDSSFGLVDKQLSSSVDLVLDDESPMQRSNLFADHSQVQSDIAVESTIQNGLTSEPDIVCPSKTSFENSRSSPAAHLDKESIVDGKSDHLASGSDIENSTEICSTDIVTVLAVSNQSSPAKDSTIPSNNSVNEESIDKGGIISQEDMNDYVVAPSVNDPKIIPTSTSTSPETEPCEVAGVDGKLGKQLILDVIENNGSQSEPLSECHDIEVIQSNSMPNAHAIVPAQVPHMPSLTDTSESVDNSITVDDHIKRVISMDSVIESGNLVASLIDNSEIVAASIAVDNKFKETISPSTDSLSTIELKPQLAKSQDDQIKKVISPSRDSSSIVELKPQLAECKDVEVSNSNSTPNALMGIPAQVAPLPLTHSSESVANSITEDYLALPSTDSQTCSPIQDASVFVADQSHILPSTKSEIPVQSESGETQVYFRLPNLKETLYSAIGFECSPTTESYANISCDISEENYPPEVIDSSTEVQASISSYQLPESNDSHEMLDDDFSNLSVSSFTPALIEDQNMEKSEALKTGLDVKCSLLSEDSLAGPDLEKSVVSEERYVISTNITPVMTEHEEKSFTLDEHSTGQPTVEDLEPDFISGTSTVVMELGGITPHDFIEYAMKRTNSKDDEVARENLVQGRTNDPSLDLKCSLLSEDSLADPDLEKYVVSEERCVISSNISPVITEDEEKSFTLETHSTGQPTVEDLEPDFISGNSTVVMELRGITPRDFIEYAMKRTNSKDDEVARENLVQGRTSDPSLITTEDPEDLIGPSNLTEKQEDLKKMDVSCPKPVAEPVVSKDSTSPVNNRGVGVPSTSSGHEKANMKPTTQMPSPVTAPSKRIPVKTLAQIKASAKPRISTGRPSSSTLKNKPSSSKSVTQSSGKKVQAPPITTPIQSPNPKEERIIPGTVNGSKI